MVNGGWYEHNGQMHYWDGYRWTGHTAPLPVAPPPPQDRRAWPLRHPLLTALAALLVIGSISAALGSGGGGSSSSVTTTTATTGPQTLAQATVDPSVAAYVASVNAAAAASREAASVAWIPKGYQVLEDGIAMAWVKRPSCPYGMGCGQAYFVVRDGCPTSMYVQATTLDGSGVQVGFTNDLLGPVLPGAKVKATLTGQSDVRSFSDVRVTCR